MLETARTVGPHNVLVEPVLPHVLCEEVERARRGAGARAVGLPAWRDRPARRG
ncbi:MAG: hypothetical protein IRY94_16670 [Rhodospirillaceae bacterium]|nr:hypothetical protein [Rhodospirillaceae bacterium]